MILCSQLSFDNCSPLFISEELYRSLLSDDLMNNAPMIEEITRSAVFSGLFIPELSRDHIAVNESVHVAKMEIQAPIKKFATLKSVSLRSVNNSHCYRRNASKSDLYFVADEPFAVVLYYKRLILFVGRCLNPCQ